MVEADIKDFISSLQEYTKLLKINLEEDVRVVMNIWTDNIISLTPVGDSTKFEFRYKLREERYGLKPVEGLLLGNWHTKINNDKTLFYESGFDSTGAKFKGSTNQAMHSYNLGDTIYVMNATPYALGSGFGTDKNGNPAGSIESGYSSQAPDGLIGPSLEAITSIYKVAFPGWD